jgi:hypothetical protein
MDPHRKVISFSLWGSIPNYTIGAVKVARQAQYWYPEYECWFYIHKPSVPTTTVRLLTGLPNTKIIYKDGNVHTCKPMTWRFESIDHPEVEINLSRDVDTRFLERERRAVDEWVTSNTLFHIMRDHPHHNFVILGGMFGTRKLQSLPSWRGLIETKVHQRTHRNYDQDFLRDYIYPIIRNSCVIHSTFHRFGPEIVRPFSTPYCENYYFIGEYRYYDDSRRWSDVTMLKSALERKL